MAREQSAFSPLERDTKLPRITLRDARNQGFATDVFKFADLILLFTNQCTFAEFGDNYEVLCVNITNDAYNWGTLIPLTQSVF